jgi:hypothetical protein
MAAAENCTVCHDPNVVAEILPDVVSFAQYPPSVVTPTPFSCENCHWGQNVVDAQSGFDGTPATDYLAGHPSDFNHRNRWDQFVGYFEYEKEIVHNDYSHHMGEYGYVAGMCWKCHANDPNDPSYDPDDPELIRYCEICHDIRTLHAGIPEHVGPPGTGGGPAVEGWEAAGFHVPGSADGIPDTYRGNALDGFGGSYFEANEMCFGCHGDDVPPYTGDSGLVPYLGSVSPTSACPTGLITISGSNFGDIREDGEDYIELREIPGGTWTQPLVPSYHSWADSQIIFEIQAWDYDPGNYRIRVTNETGTSAASAVITVYDCISPQEIWVGSSPLALGPDPYFNDGVCSNTIALRNPTGDGTFGFGSTQDQIGKDIYGVVQFSASQGDYIVKNYIDWTNTEIKFKFKTFFEDLDGDYLQDANEPDILWCENLALGTYSVYVKYIFYDDLDANHYDEGDTILQLESSNSVTFELTNAPYINKLKPKSVERNRRFRIFGVNFGPTQTTGEVHIGSQVQWNTDPINKGRIQPAHRIKLWSNTKIAVKIRVPPAWAGTNKRVWVVKDGVASNTRKLTILP